MNYIRQYVNRINWEDAPSTETPLNSTNLNKMDKALQYMDGKLYEVAQGGAGVTPNPSEEATDTLEKVKINNVVYAVDGMPENPLGTSHGGTGNAYGYIQTGALSGSTIGTKATAEGRNTTASGLASHAEGDVTIASGSSSHAEGDTTTASGNSSHAEGKSSTASGYFSHAEGYNTTASGSTAYAGTHAEGNGTTASGTDAHAEGMNTVASGDHSHAEGFGTTASGDYSHAGGRANTAGYDYQTVVGKWNDNKSTTVFEVGGGNNGGGTITRKNAFEVYPDGKVSFDNGVTKYQLTQLNGDDGYYDASGTFHAFGSGGGLPSDPLTVVHGGTGNTVGYIQTGRKNNTSIGTKATAEGYNTTASGNYSHAEGYQTTASLGNAAHAEGDRTTASNTASHAEGAGTTASGPYSHSSGYYTQAQYQSQMVTGEYNDNKSTTLFEVGNGTDLNVRNNAFEVYSDGKISCDNGSSKFQFTQSSGADGYYDASGTFHAFGGSGNTISKTWYPIIASLWSGAQNADGYYTYSFSLNPQLNNSVNVYISESANNTYPTDTERAQFALVDRVRVLGASAITLYAKTKPTSNFYVWVEGVNGSGNASIEGNVIQPNGAVSGGGEIYSTTETVIGEWLGKPLYRKVFNCGQMPFDTSLYPYTYELTTNFPQTYVAINMHCTLPSVGYTWTDNHEAISMSYNNYSQKCTFKQNIKMWSSDETDQPILYIIIEYTKS